MTFLQPDRGVRYGMMTATDFEQRHQALVHMLVVAIAFSTYAFDRDDIVWVVVRGLAHPHPWERFLFAVATLLIGGGTALRTFAHVYPKVCGIGPYRYLDHPHQLGNLLFSIGLASLAPFAGFVFLSLAEGLVFLRLIRRRQELSQPAPQDLQAKIFENLQNSARWGKAVSVEAAKWGIFLTMVIFTIALRDRLAEVLAIASLVVWAALNCGSFRTLTPR